MTAASRQIDEWAASKDQKYRGEAEALAARLEARAGKAEISIDRHGILGFGRGADGYPLIGLTVRKDGLRLYANIYALAEHKAALGKKHTGKSCVTLKRAADLDDTLLDKIVRGSLAASAMCER